MRNLTHGLKGATGSPSDDPNSNQVLLAYKARLLSIHVILPRMEPASFPNNRGDNYMLSWLLVGHSVPEVWGFFFFFLALSWMRCQWAAKGAGEWRASLPRPFLILPGARKVSWQVRFSMVSWLSCISPGALGCSSTLLLAQKLLVSPQTSRNQSERLKQQLSALIHPGRPQGKKPNWHCYHKCLKSYRHEWASVRAQGAWHLGDLASSELPLLFFQVHCCTCLVTTLLTLLFGSAQLVKPPARDWGRRGWGILTSGWPSKGCREGCCPLRKCLALPSSSVLPLHPSQQQLNSTCPTSAHPSFLKVPWWCHWVT